MYHCRNGILLMPQLLICPRCVHKVSGNCSDCPFCGRNLESGNLLFELLGRATERYKACDLSKALTNGAGYEIQKSVLNQMLYRLMAEGFVEKGTEFRWSLTRKYETEPAQTDLAAVLADQLKAAQGRADRQERNAEVTSDDKVQIGHWTFGLERKQGSDSLLWKFDCLLCGQKIQKLVRADNQVFWLWGRLRARRANHDSEAHPGKLTEQAEAEKARLGTYALERRIIDMLTDAEPKNSSHGKKPGGSLPTEPVDQITKASFGRRLTRGFNLINGNR
jgi:hypothetical protein